MAAKAKKCVGLHKSGPKKGRLKTGYRWTKKGQECPEYVGSKKAGKASPYTGPKCATGDIKVCVPSEIARKVASAVSKYKGRAATKREAQEMASMRARYPEMFRELQGLGRAKYRRKRRGGKRRRR